MHDLSTTLAAVATAPGRGGIGCIRISGPNATRIAARLSRPRKPRAPEMQSTPRFVTFLDAAGCEIDHGYLVEFPADASFTGEPTAELWAHGSPPVLEALVSAAQAAGAELAGPGEFTYRALRHGRVDLARAEAIRDLVAARTAYQARVAFSQLRGAVARKLAPLTERLVDLIARGEAAIEFADEAETHLEPGGLAAGVEAALAEARGLAADARRGRVVQQGARIALVGAPSVGKSSLFNRLLGTHRAIVSPTPGTTRDTIEEIATFGGIPATLIDTAGLRAPRTAIEAEGVRRAWAAAEEADLTLFVLDASRMASDEERGNLAARAAGEPAPIVVANKWDIASSPEVPVADAIPVSAATGEGVPQLRAAIARSLLGSAPMEDPVITDLRQTRALDEVVAALERAAGVASVGDEVVVEELRDALRALGSITGEVGNEELYDRIFSTFCIGK